jgi:hypothetical protein
MTCEQLLPLIEQYRAGLDAELMLLHRLQALAIEQRRAAQIGSPDEIRAACEGRERVLATLLTIELELKGVRQRVLAVRESLVTEAAFQDVVDRLQEGADLVASIMVVDRDSIEALKDAEQARRIAAQFLEQGESTLAAYRRVVSPNLTPATLVNRRS